MLGRRPARYLISTSHRSMQGPPDSISITHQPKATRGANLGGLLMLSHGHSQLWPEPAQQESRLTGSLPWDPRVNQREILATSFHLACEIPMPRLNAKEKLGSVSLVSLTGHSLPPSTSPLKLLSELSSYFSFLVPSFALYLPRPASSLFSWTPCP